MDFTVSRNTRRRGKVSSDSTYERFTLTNHLAELIELKRKWKEDVEKVEQLKAAKHFKPY